MLIKGRKTKHEIINQNLEDVKKQYPDIDTDKLVIGTSESGKCRKLINKTYCEKLLHELNICDSNSSNEHYIIVKEDIYIFKAALISLIKEIN